MRGLRGIHSLAGKLSLAFSGLVASCAVLLAVTGYVDGRVVLEREAHARYESIVRSVAFNAEYAVLTRNVLALEQIVQGVTQEEDVNFVSVKDVSGTVMASAGTSGKQGTSVSQPVYLRRAPDQDNVEYLFGGVGGEVKESSAPQERVGEVLIQFNTSFIREKLAGMRRHTTTVALAVILIGILVTSLLSRFLVLPLKDLASATARVAMGELNHQVMTRSRDEIGELANAFNIMIENLKEFTVSRDYLDALLDAIPDAILVIDEKGILMTVNKGALDLSGFREDEILGAGLDKLLLLEENVIHTKTGDPIPVSVSRGGLKGEDGASLGTVYVAHDVRPMQKLQERLLQTEKMAAVGQLAAGVSHEINNPLGVILGFAQGLCRRLEPGHPMEVPLHSIEREAMRCKDLVQDLLTFSRTSHVEREPMDLNAAVEGALSLVSAQARMDRAEVKPELTPGLPRIFGSKNQIQQIVINLAKNGLDAMPEGGAVRVITELEETGGRAWVCLRVRDHGTGIPPDILPRIFDPFFTTKPVGKGTGLGLALVYEIVKKHSGLLDVKSRPGETEFIIKFPVRTGREVEERRLRAESERRRRLAGGTA